MSNSAPLPTCVGGALAPPRLRTHSQKSAQRMEIKSKIEIEPSGPASN